MVGCSFPSPPSASQHRLHNPFLLRFSSLPRLFSLGLALFLVHLIACDLFLFGYVDGVLTRRLVAEYRRKMERGVAPAQECASVKVRPREYAWVCCHPSFLPWQLVYRYACPMVVAGLHCGVSMLTHGFARLHTRGFFGIDLRSITTDHARRKAARATKKKGKSSSPSARTGASASAIST